MKRITFNVDEKLHYDFKKLVLQEHKTMTEILTNHISRRVKNSKEGKKK